MTTKKQSKVASPSKAKKRAPAKKTIKKTKAAAPKKTHSKVVKTSSKSVSKANVKKPAVVAKMTQKAPAAKSKGLDKKTKLRFDFFFVQTEDVKNLLLNILAMDTNAAATDLIAVTDYIMLIG